MFTLNHPVFRVTALAALLGSTILATPAYAVLNDAPLSAGPPSTSVNIDSSGRATVQPDINAPGGAMQEQVKAGNTKKGEARHMKFSPEKMKERVEERIKTLHTKLGITKEQEPAWNDVAQAMRDNEVTISSLIRERHDKTKARTAVDDLNSYQKIAQAHADGLKKVSASFEELYKDMSDAQKKNADKVFAEGHGLHMKHMKGQKKSG
ncbi:MAG: Spy/CpxP family protein refolding chaperone [Alphaproteobacteria bacterium]|nr:Spy/CpxP family protein refolding chaperone [Alphaproteobacteria bacterium]